MWESLPPLALLIVYQLLSAKDKLSASSSCRKWREALFNPRCSILQHLTVNALCQQSLRKDPSCSIKSDLLHPKFLRHTTELTIVWTGCAVSQVRDILQDLTSGINQVKSLTLKPKFRTLCLKQCKDIGKNSDIEAEMINALKALVLQSSGLKSLSFGFAFQNCLPAVCSWFEERQRCSGKSLYIQRLNCSALTVLDKVIPVYNCGAINHFHLDPVLSPSLSSFSINLDSDLLEILDKLCKGNVNPNFELSLYLEDTHTGGLPASLELDKDLEKKKWKEVKVSIPNLRVNLILIQRNGTFHLAWRRLVAGFPVYSLNLFCDIYPHIAEVVVSNVLQDLFTKSLVSLGIHYYETARVRNMDVVEHIPHMIAQYENLEKLSLTGVFVSDASILETFSMKPSLKEFNIPRNYIMTKSLSTSWYFLTMSNPQLYGLEKAVYTTYGRKWKALKAKPVKRPPHRKSLEQEEVILDEIQEIMC